MPAKKPPMRENISSRPTDKYGNRATDADLGIGPGADARRRAAAMKITAQEGTTNPSGGRPASKPQAAPKPKAKAATSSMPLVDKFVSSLKKESTPYTMGGSKK